MVWPLEGVKVDQFSGCSISLNHKYLANLVHSVYTFIHQRIANVIGFPTIWQHWLVDLLVGLLKGVKVSFNRK